MNTDIPTTEATTSCIAVCNSLLRGEISAVEAYSKAIEKFAGEPQVGELSRIRGEHQLSVDALRENVLSMGGMPEIESGPWGTFAKGAQLAANLFGDESALFMLKQGEQHGQSEYESALENDDVMAKCKDLMRTALLRRVNEHIAALDRMAEAV